MGVGPTLQTSVGCGAVDRVRTGDLDVGNVALYRLSYNRAFRASAIAARHASICTVLRTPIVSRRTWSNCSTWSRDDRAQTKLSLWWSFCRPTRQTAPSPTVCWTRRTTSSSVICTETRTRIGVVGRSVRLGLNTTNDPSPSSKPANQATSTSVIARISAGFLGAASPRRSARA